MKIGLFGGAFDPIHNGHLIIAQYIQDELDLSRVIFIPAGIPPRKQVLSRPEDRIHMIALSITDNPDFACSQIEISSSSTSYSVNTIRHFKDQFSAEEDELFWLMGADNFMDLPNWRNPGEIAGMCRIVVFPRSGFAIVESKTEYHGSSLHLTRAPILDISSTLVRLFLQQDRSIRYLVPSSVEQYITKTKLYI